MIGNVEEKPERRAKGIEELEIRLTVPREQERDKKSKAQTSSASKARDRRL
jgi:hypothetical protein